MNRYPVAALALALTLACSPGRSLFAQATDLERRIEEFRARRAARGDGSSGNPVAASLPPRGVMHPARLRVGVLPFDAQAQLPENFVTNLEAMLISEGMKRTNWTMLDRVILGEVTREQDLAAAGRVRRGTGPSSTRNLGAQVLIKGALTEVTAQSSGGRLGLDFGGFSIGRGGSKSHLGMDIRIVDAATGEILVSDHASTKIKSSDLSIGVPSMGFGGPALSLDKFKNSPAGPAARQLVGRILEMVDASISKVRIETPHQASWTGRVAKVEGNAVYINGGTNQDLQLGQRFVIHREQQAVVDPQTGESLGATSSPVAAVRVVDVQERYSVCEILEGGPVAVNDVVGE